MVKSWRAYKKISKLNPKKWVFRGPNKALTKSRFKRPNWSHLGRGTKCEGEGEEKRKRKKKKRRRGRGDQAKKVWKLTLIMNSM